MHPAMTFTLHDLEARVHQRAAASADVSYTRKLIDKGVAHCAKKLGEEAVETALAAVGEDREHLIAEAADLLYHLLVVLEARGVTLAEVEAELARAHRAVGPRREGVAQGRLAARSRPDGTAHRKRPLALPHAVARRMGGAARRHADDADRPTR